MNNIFGLTKPGIDSQLYEFYRNNVRIDMFLEYFFVIALIALLAFGIPCLITILVKPKSKLDALGVFGFFYLHTFAVMIGFILFFAFIAPIIFFFKGLILQILPDLPALFGLVLFLPFLGAFAFISWPVYVIESLFRKK